MKIYAKTIIGAGIVIDSLLVGTTACTNSDKYYKNDRISDGRDSAITIVDQKRYTTINVNTKMPADDLESLQSMIKRTMHDYNQMQQQKDSILHEMKLLRFLIF